MATTVVETTANRRQDDDMIGSFLATSFSIDLGDWVIMWICGRFVEDGWFWNFFLFLARFDGSKVVVVRFDDLRLVFGLIGIGWRFCVLMVANMATIGKAKGKFNMYIPTWYQSLSMDQRMETLENAIQSLSNGQQALLHLMIEFMSQVNSKIDQFSNHTRGETSKNKEVSYNPSSNNHNHASGVTYTPKLVKLDFLVMMARKIPSVGSVGPSNFSNSIRH
ncbi:hypothetical protein Patl1_32639 [Pistacia atlantica]|uniref:Uncharacterized protein n=1 Tax=Pistacia atlantica TaxID=434234 RepID=A0ACC1AMA8_9ROSI|nr:hypothetical protein Patl1_32639 [Pistacia atlantica]